MLLSSEDALSASGAVIGPGWLDHFALFAVAGLHAVLDVLSECTHSYFYKSVEMCFLFRYSRKIFYFLVELSL